MSTDDAPTDIPAPTPAEVARRLLALRREIRDEDFRGRTLHHHICARTRERRPVLAERSEIVAMLDDYAASVGRLRGLRDEAARLGALLDALTPAPPRPPSVPLTPEVLARVVRAVIAGRRDRR